MLSKWNGVVAEIGAENDILARCRSDAHICPAAAQKFLDVIADGRAARGRARIGVINRAINLAIQPMSDMAQWGVADRWSAPLATLTSGRGDCEDYAIAKYVALREAGVAEDDVRLVIVRDLANGEDHAVVAARARRKVDRARQSPPDAARGHRHAARAAAVRLRSRRRQAIRAADRGSATHAGAASDSRRRPHSVRELGERV